MNRAMRLFLLILLILAVTVPLLITPIGRAAPAAPPAGAQRYVIVPGESSVTYRVAETFINEGNRFNIAVGVTNVVRGEIFIDRARPANSRVGTITVDISQFRSDRQRRDSAIRDRWLESSRFPMAEFTPTAIQGLPEAYQDGRELQLQMTGNLKIRDVTKPTTFAVTLKLEGNVLTGAATSMIKMTDFGFEPPSIFGILRSENEARLEFRFIAKP
ncbi:MAG: YceI family protein [Armatimonadota bacterium]